MGNFNTVYCKCVSVLSIAHRYFKNSEHCLSQNVNQCHYRPEVSRVLQEVKFPRLRDNDTGWW